MPFSGVGTPGFGCLTEGRWAGLKGLAWHSPGCATLESEFKKRFRGDIKILLFDHVTFSLSLPGFAIQLKHYHMSGLKVTKADDRIAVVTFTI